MTQTDRVLIALTKQGPRTARNISVETNIPEPSVRRVLSSLSLSRLLRAYKGAR